MFRTKLTRTLIAVAAATLMTVTLMPQAEARGFRGFFERSSGGANAGLVERLDQLGDFTILLTALDTAGLTGTVASAEALTILAPTDEAFAALLEELGISAADLLASPDLTDILLYHVVPGKSRASALLYNSINPTLLTDNSVIVKLESFRLFVNDARVVRPNVRASNGYIQVIDRVLLPSDEAGEVANLVDVLALDGRFSILLTALDTAGLTGALEDADTELTVFAPTDDAFAALLGELGISAGDLLASPDLADILLYHVAAGNKRGLELLIGGGTDTLLAGESVSVRIRRGGLFVNDSKVISPNVAAPNGVIHVIDAVLLP
jgi:uncharacterized surface protein with fasciclin (FAS1) repeats